MVVADREGDIYSGFARCPAGVDLIVRAAQDRVLDDGTRLFGAAASWPELARTEVVVAPSRVGVRSRVAKVVLRAGSIVISRPRHGGDRSDPPHLTMHMVEAREIDGPVGVAPLLWRLLTTRPVTSAAEAQEIVRLYRLRWRIDIDQPWRLSRFKVGFVGVRLRRGQAAPRRGRGPDRFQIGNRGGVGHHQLCHAVDRAAG